MRASVHISQQTPTHPDIVRSWRRISDEARCGPTAWRKQQALQELAECQRCPVLSVIGRGHGRGEDRPRNRRVFVDGAWRACPFRMGFGELQQRSRAHLKCDFPVADARVPWKPGWQPAGHGQQMPDAYRLGGVVDDRTGQMHRDRIIERKSASGAICQRERGRGRKAFGYRVDGISAPAFRLRPGAEPSAQDDPGVVRNDQNPALGFGDEALCPALERGVQGGC